MARFVGQFEHTLDPKGRLILPAKFRAAFSEGGFLTRGLGGCIALYTPGIFDREMDRMQEWAATGRVELNRVRVWSASSAEIDVDRQGRMAIPAKLREYAGLSAEVFIIGTLDRIELWDPGRWADRVLVDEELDELGQPVVS